MNPSDGELFDTMEGRADERTNRMMGVVLIAVGMVCFTAIVCTLLAVILG